MSSFKVDLVQVLFAIFFSFYFNSYSDELSLTRYKGNFCYDGDTCYAILENVPEKLKFVRIRIRGIDTPERVNVTMKKP